MNNEFYERYHALVHDCARNDYSDNHDYFRFGPLTPPNILLQPFATLRSMKASIAGTLRKAAHELGIRNSPGSNVHKTAAAALDWVEPCRAQLAWLYDRLADEHSRQLLISIMAYRALGHRRVKLPLNTPDFWNMRQRLESLTCGTETMETGFRGWKVHRMRLEPFGYPLELFMRPSGIHSQMLLQQYRCATDNDVIEAAAGDNVIDAGGCYGDTAFYFAHKIGEKGHVYSCEFVPVNIAIFQRNLELNPEYAKRITLIKQPLWSQSGVELFMESNGPATSVQLEANGLRADSVRSLCIDQLISQASLEKLNFIKMDIEGAELAALKGGEMGIRQFKPKLAISVYHRLRDFWEIPEWIDGLGLNYSLYLRHFTIHQEETILFAQA